MISFLAFVGWHNFDLQTLVKCQRSPCPAANSVLRRKVDAVPVAMIPKKQEIAPLISSSRMTQSLCLSSYQEKATESDQLRDSAKGFQFYLLGLVGETGSLLSEVKKKQRDQVAYVGYRDSVEEELGDTLWYLAALANRAGVRFGDLVSSVDDSNEQGRRPACGSSTLCDVDAASGSPSLSPSPDFERTLLRLSAKVGQLMVDYDSGLIESDHMCLRRRLAAILQTLNQAAHEAGITLESAAQANLGKVFDRWPSRRVLPPLPDQHFPEAEQLPRELTVSIAEIEVDGRLKAQLTVDGRNLGDPLTDNRAEDDDYRFHDVFHLAYAAHLGWSPTLRRLLRVKRKSNPEVDEVQDGARAVLIEEGIATWIFNHAQRLNFFEGLTSLDYGLLKSVRQFVAGYEADSFPLWLWEDAILRGYEVFRQVRIHRGGKVAIDLNSRSIGFDVP